LSFLGYGKKIIDAILLIGPVAFVTVFFSHATHFASLEDYKTLTSMTRKAFRLLMYFSIPVTAILLGLREPIIRILFEGGKFGTESTLGTSQAFMIYSCGLVTFSLESLIVHSFFALSDTKTPVKLGILCVILDIVLAVLFLKPYGYLGIASALVISKTVKVCILLFLLNRQLKGLLGIQLLLFSLKIVIIALLMWVSMRLIVGLQTNATFLSTVIFDLILPSIAGMSVLAVCSYAFNIQEFRTIVSILKKKSRFTETFIEQED
ncbi:hypothetical protein LCGC14_2296460, partial [marine sediment metagenome]